MKANKRYQNINQAVSQAAAEDDPKTKWALYNHLSSNNSNHWSKFIFQKWSLTLSQYYNN